MALGEIQNFLATLYVEKRVLTQYIQNPVQCVAQFCDSKEDSLYLSKIPKDKLLKFCRLLLLKKFKSCISKNIPLAYQLFSDRL